MPFAAALFLSRPDDATPGLCSGLFDVDPAFGISLAYSGDFEGRKPYLAPKSIQRGFEALVRRE